MSTPSRCIVSRANKALLVPRSGKSVNLFPNAPALDDYLVLDHDVRSVICLRAIGYEVPNPMLCYYNWKGAQPFAVQRATCDMLTTKQRGYVQSWWAIRRRIFSRQSSVARLAKSQRGSRRRAII